MSPIYLDNAATTKPDPRVIETVMKCLKDDYGNPSSLHHFGERAYNIIEQSRRRVAELLNAEQEDIIFTSGGTESDNLAILGALKGQEEGHLITTSIEHPAVKKTFYYLETKGFDITYLPVGPDGIVDEEDFKKSVREDTILASVMYANNEVGTIQPVENLADIAEKNDIIFHTDAVQAVGQLEINLKKSNIDLLSLSGHKIYGPKGTGALYVSEDRDISQVLYGGRHEKGKRPGTENVPGVAGLGKACEIARKEMSSYVQEMIRLRDLFIEGLIGEIDLVRLNGHRKKRLPNNANISFPGVQGDILARRLDSEGIAVSTGSACSSKGFEPSEVILSMYDNRPRALSSVRFTFGKWNTEEEIYHSLDILPQIVKNLKRISPKGRF